MSWSLSTREWSRDAEVPPAFVGYQGAYRSLVCYVDTPLP